MIGVDPQVFWGLTPWQFSLCVEAYSKKQEQEHDHKAWLMWHGAVLGRVQKMPPLSDFTSGKKNVKRIDEHAIIARLKAYQKRASSGTSS
jgi:hypothetical protein